MIEKIDLYNGQGFVRLISVFGSDQTIEQAARISYQSGTRKTSDTRNLIRYLVRHRHTSPLEQAELQFELKIPIFVMRQHVRHRTQNLNEASLRYSEAMDDMYLPVAENIKKQSSTNKQGSGDKVSNEEAEEFLKDYKEVYDLSLEKYKKWIGKDVAREMARICLPVANFTSVVWKSDLHNLFHYLKLRTDSHAQQEIIELATAIYHLSKPHFPLSFEAWEDYSRDSKTLSRMDQTLLQELLVPGSTINVAAGLLDRDEMFKRNGERFGMSKREWDDFFNWYNSLKWYEAKEY